MRNWITLSGETNIEGVLLMLLPQAATGMSRPAGNNESEESSMRASLCFASSAEEESRERHN